MRIVEIIAPGERRRVARLFCESMGFQPLEVFPALWDEGYVMKL